MDMHYDRRYQMCMMCRKVVLTSLLQERKQVQPVRSFEQLLEDLEVYVYEQTDRFVPEKINGFNITFDYEYTQGDFVYLVFRAEDKDGHHAGVSKSYNLTVFRSICSMAAEQQDEDAVEQALYNIKATVHEDMAILLLDLIDNIKHSKGGAT
ncbi:hypothetical protein [Ruminococcus sp.]|uniref:hypothetical protein n=1 Tax=Ruminococcus sp. TaxID=41978 RepID=UPI001B671249|nr:hypothetical protein [Ruminococcus sp.]MBP5433617.1 hypothetical protein [Ruminococcus sp.]